MPANPPAETQSASELKALVEAERLGRPFLVFRDRDRRQQLFFFVPGASSAAVGRLPSADLVLAWDDRVSRLHARFEGGDDGWVLVDDGLSSNGTFVNDERLSGSRALNDGDVLRFGTTTVTFRWPARHAPPSTDAEDKPAAVAPSAAAPSAAAPSAAAPSAAASPASASPSAAAPSAATVPLSSTQRRVLAALCRPYRARSGSAEPATDEQIATELIMTVGEVRAHLRVLCAKLGVEGLPADATRRALVERASAAGLIPEGKL